MTYAFYTLYVLHYIFFIFFYFASLLLNSPLISLKIHSPFHYFQNYFILNRFFSISLIHTYFNSPFVNFSLISPHIPYLFYYFFISYKSQISSSNIYLLHLSVSTTERPLNKCFVSSSYIILWFFQHMFLVLHLIFAINLIISPFCLLPKYWGNYGTSIILYLCFTFINLLNLHLFHIFYDLLFHMFL